MGYEVDGLEGMLERHMLENLCYAGYEVPDDFILGEERYHTKSKQEKELYWRMKMMERLEAERTDPLKAPTEEAREEGRKRKGWGELEYEREEDSQPDRVRKC